MMQIVVLKKFRDKYTGEEYRPGRLLTVTEERAEELFKALPPRFILAVDNGEGEPEKTAEEAANQPQEANETAEKSKAARRKAKKGDAE